MSTMKLRDAIRKFPVLSDGEQDWEPQVLLEVLEKEEDEDEALELGYVLLEDCVYVDETGIRRIEKNGYLGSYLYRAKTSASRKEDA
jgi:hypothetical protein